MSCGKILKVILPHLSLTLLIALYLSMGAFVFQTIEINYDYKILEEKAKKIVNIYESVAFEVESMCSNAITDMKLRKRLYDMLSMISEAHEGRSYKVNPRDPNSVDSLIKSRWTYSDAFLYSVSILTTTGYTNSIPLTNAGQIFAVVYGLVGIPLMVLMAVDIGRFLSDVVLICCSKLVTWWDRFLGFFECIIKIKDISNGKEQLDPQNLTAKLDNTQGQTRLRKLPLWAIFVILLLFNVLGALVYMAQSETKQNFLKAFFICFNLMVNLTMGEINVVVNNASMIIYIVFFVTFGLAVLSMCADLAASELKWMFLKIHYFGRKIKEQKYVQELLKALNDKEVKELLKIINEIRLQNPSMEGITRQDIINYIQIKAELTQCDFLTVNDCSFKPEGLEILKFADAEEMDASSMRRIPSVAIISVEPMKAIDECELNKDHTN